MSTRRVRQHVNPFSYRGPVEVPPWEELFARPNLPLEVDVGCAHGDFLIGRARLDPDCNYLGLEIRAPMVERTNHKLAREGLDNIRLIRCNANQAWRDLFAGRLLRRVFVHFPDPWFKSRHHKRRVVTPEFVQLVGEFLEVGGEFRFMTDYDSYASDVRKLMAGQATFQNRYGPGGVAPALEEGFPLTHREEWHSGQGHPVHRYVWVRT
ncbi:MAG: tRNA (guanosine(46)-N7)-methyltransferase TrmB [Planctomycetes bacterium]|nr:tRNA (guanosine(46)-N7)-methyltransferase TrmB [Planctomycetota bacterium]